MSTYTVKTASLGCNNPLHNFALTVSESNKTFLKNIIIVDASYEVNVKKARGIAFLDRKAEGKFVFTLNRKVSMGDFSEVTEL